MTTPIRTNKPVFFGNNGEVLKSGYIYIGQPRQDPRNFPKTVTFKDSAGGLFTAAQPLRTNAQGQISYNGKAIIALVDGDYSLLVQDSNQVQTKDGWTPLIQASDLDPSESTVTYRTLLSDLKLVNVTPGQYVENIGKLTAQDSDGARWLVVSSTGSPGDDVDLIDFDNGTQGVRIENQLYAVKNLSEIAAAGASAQTSARANLGQSTSVNIADNAVITSKIDALAVTAPKLAANSVLESKINNSAVTNSKLASDAVTTDKILNGTILSGDIKIRTDTFPVSVSASSTTVNVSSVGGSIINVAYAISFGNAAISTVVRVAGATTTIYIEFAGSTLNEGDLLVNYIATS